MNSTSLKVFNLIALPCLCPPLLLHLHYPVARKGVSCLVMFSWSPRGSRVYRKSYMKTSIRATNCNLLDYVFRTRKTKEVATNWNQSLLYQNWTVFSLALKVCLSNFSILVYGRSGIFLFPIFWLVFIYDLNLKTFKIDLLTRKYSTSLITRQLSALNS